MVCMSSRLRLSLIRLRAASGRTLSSTPSADDYWPDGTPKKFRGREAWKNWVRWDSPHREQTDELNRARHYFWHVDGRGRLWRKELDQPGRTFGQMRDARTLDFFFSHMQRNETGLYANDFPFISFRMHEHYFTCATREPFRLVHCVYRHQPLRSHHPHAGRAVTRP
jgi:hypothetical protein